MGQTDPKYGFEYPSCGSNIRYPFSKNKLKKMINNFVKTWAVLLCIRHG